jgi:bifunctional DNA-binding transcriptional regulator/antitoxin component of YhaV-PrlF toxin-antitoxin module
MTSKGRTTVPKEIRDALDLHPGDQLHWDQQRPHHHYQAARVLPMGTRNQARSRRCGAGGDRSEEDQRTHLTRGEGKDFSRGDAEEQSRSPPLRALRPKASSALKSRGDMVDVHQLFGPSVIHPEAFSRDAAGREEPKA